MKSQVLALALLVFLAAPAFAQTVSVKDGNIQFTDKSGQTTALTSSGRDSGPVLAPDGARIGTFNSVWRRERVRSSLWIGGGAIVLALSTSMSRTGDYSLMYLGELIGIAAMFYGFVLPSIAARVSPPTPAPARRSALAH